MAQMTITGSPVVVSVSDTIFQNLGPSVLYVGVGSSVSASDGIRVEVGGFVQFKTTGSTHSMVASGGDCDVRYLTTVADAGDSA